MIYVSWVYEIDRGCCFLLRLLPGTSLFNRSWTVAGVGGGLVHSHCHLCFFIHDLSTRCSFAYSFCVDGWHLCFFSTVHIGPFLSVFIGVTQKRYRWLVFSICWFWSVHLLHDVVHHPFGGISTNVLSGVARRKCGRCHGPYVENLIFILFVIF